MLRLVLAAIALATVFANAKDVSAYPRPALAPDHTQAAAPATSARLPSTGARAPASAPQVRNDTPAGSRWA